MHPTISQMMAVVAEGREDEIAPLLAEEVQFLPPTYWKTWVGRAPVAAVLGHVGRVFEGFRYRRVMGQGVDWALEFECKIGALDAVGVDLITLDEAGLIVRFEVDAAFEISGGASGCDECRGGRRRAVLGVSECVAVSALGAVTRIEGWGDANIR